MDNYESAKLDHDGAQRPFHNAVQYRLPWGRNALAGAMPVLVIGCAMPRHDSAQGRRLFHNWLFWFVILECMVSYEQRLQFGVSYYPS